MMRIVDPTPEVKQFYFSKAPAKDKLSKWLSLVRPWYSQVTRILQPLTQDPQYGTRFTQAVQYLQGSTYIAPTGSTLIPSSAPLLDETQIVLSILLMIMATSNQTLSPLAANLRATYDQNNQERWLATVRPHYQEFIELLSSATNPPVVKAREELRKYVPSPAAAVFVVGQPPIAQGDEAKTVLSVLTTAGLYAKATNNEELSNSLTNLSRSIQLLKGSRHGWFGLVQFILS